MSDFFQIGRGVKPSGAVFHAVRDESALGVYVGNQSAQRFEVGRDGDALRLSVLKTLGRTVWVVHTFAGTGVLDCRGIRFADILVVGGGGTGGGGELGGGGGAGAVIHIENARIAGEIDAVVGSGGVVEQVGGYASGGQSSFGSIVAYGGGYGGFKCSPDGTATNYVTVAPSAGASGGGGWRDAANNGYDGASGDGIYGHDGGDGVQGTLYGGLGSAGGGGGGAGYDGADAEMNYGGGGGDGVPCDIAGHTTDNIITWYGGGGGGSAADHSYTPVQGLGGEGGGGDAVIGYTYSASRCGVDGKGGGGGGATSLAPYHQHDGWGGDGGDGVVVVRYRANPRHAGTGGSITYLDDYGVIISEATALEMTA